MIRHNYARLRLLVVMGLLIWMGGTARAEDPFAAGADALAVSDSDGSSSLRAKKKLTKMAPDMVLAQVTAVDDRHFPHCLVYARVLKTAQSKEKHFKLMARGKVYRFSPVLKLRHLRIDLNHPMTQNNLGACYYPKRTTLVLKVSGVDFKKKAFKAAEVYVK